MLSHMTPKFAQSGCLGGELGKYNGCTMLKYLFFLGDWKDVTIAQILNDIDYKPMM